MTTLPASTVPFRPRASSSGPPACPCGQKACMVCVWNAWVETHTCRWCSTIVLDGDGHETDHGVFCGVATNSLCRHLFFEHLEQRARFQ